MKKITKNAALFGAKIVFKDPLRHFLLPEPVPRFLFPVRQRLHILELIIVSVH